MLSTRLKKPTLATQDQEHYQEIIIILTVLGFFKTRYPPKLQADRRAAFITKIEQISNSKVSEKLKNESQKDN